MRILKYTFLVFLLLFCTTIFAQKNNVLKLRNKKNYKEQVLFYKDSVMYILYEVCFDNPSSLDEEWCRSISFTIRDSKKFKKGMRLDILNDTAIISTGYNRLALLNGCEISGMIEVEEVNEEVIRINMNISVNEKTSYIYKGHRIFRRPQAAL